MSNQYEIICVDDDLDVLDVTVMNVETLGYKAVGFKEVEEACKYISEHKKNIVLILSDLRMDNINGFEFKEKLKKCGSEIPFVIITGYWTNEMSLEAMALGINSFIQKPATVEIIGEQIDKFGSERIAQLDDEREMIQGFLEETTPMLDEIEQLILELEESPDSDQTLSVYFRLLHTIKGTASCVGLIELGNYTHKYEDFISEMRNKVIPVTTKSINILLQGLDDLKHLFEGTTKTLSDDFFDLDALTEKYAMNQDFGAVEEDQQSRPEATKSVTSEKAEEKSKDDDKMIVSMSILNNFMEESGELTVIRNSILKTVKKIEGKYRGDHDVELLNELLDGMYNVTSNIQGKITEMRQVPLRNTFRPFKRLIRDLSKQLKKEVEFVVEGEELLVDNTVAKLYSNTLIHLLRNSLDHGLESPEEREAIHKERTGTIEISVKEVGEDIVMTIKDDGKGIDPDVIKRKAIEKELYSREEISELSHLEIINIIFDSGFSTAEQVSDLSGRGVGMDMVRSSFIDMGGNVFVQSEKGSGSTFTLTVPIPKSVLIINSLLVTAAEQSFIFPMDEVSEVIRYENDTNTSRMYEYEGKKLIEHNSETIHLVEMNDVLGLGPKKDSDVQNIVVLRINQRKFGIFVDEIHEFEEVVSRKISDSIDSSDLFHGASLLGTGEVAMIISAEGFASRCGFVVEDHSSSKFRLQEEETVIENHSEYMTFKYNDELPLCIPLEQVERLEKINSLNFEVVGSKLYTKYLDKVMPIIDPAHIIGLDTGFDMSKLCNNKADQEYDVIVANFNGKQYGLLVYELNEIKSSSESVNIDTIGQDGLIGSVFLDGSTVCIIDLKFITEHFKKRSKEKQDENLEINFAQAA